MRKALIVSGVVTTVCAALAVLFAAAAHAVPVTPSPGTPTPVPASPSAPAPSAGVPAPATRGPSATADAPTLDIQVVSRHGERAGDAESLIYTVEVRNRGKDDREDVAVVMTQDTYWQRTEVPKGVRRARQELRWIVDLPAGVTRKIRLSIWSVPPATDADRRPLMACVMDDAAPVACRANWGPDVSGDAKRPPRVMRGVDVIGTLGLDPWWSLAFAVAALAVGVGIAYFVVYVYDFRKGYRRRPDVSALAGDLSGDGPSAAEKSDAEMARSR